MKIRNLIAVFFLIVLALGAYVYFFIYHKAHEDIYTAEPDITITAEELYMAFQEDELSANDTYLGKIIRVSGTVLEVEVENGGEISAIRLDVGEILDGVVCEMDRVYLRETGEIQPGDEITLQGVCTGYLEDVILNRCGIIDIE